MIARNLTLHDDRPRDDHIVVLHNATWADFQRMLEMRGDRSVPRLAFGKGRLEIMSPAENHAAIKSLIGCLVEVFCLERDVEFRTVGSWTLEDKGGERGVEPDECYVFGPPREAKRPDLAIEVVWTSGGIDKLDIYRALGVREVWSWRKGAITVWTLVNDAYVEGTASAVLAGIDLAQLASHLDRPTTSAAMREYRDALRATR